MKKIRLIIVTMMVVIPLLVTSCVQQVTETPEVETEEPVVEETEEEVVEEPTEEETEEVVEEETEELGPVLKIGQIGQMSGLMALYGMQQQRGFELGLEYMSGGEMDDEGRYIIANRPVEVIVKDDEGDPEKAVALALELIERDGVEIIQGPVSSASAIALTNVALENEIILMIDPAASYFMTGAYFNPFVFPYDSSRSKKPLYFSISGFSEGFPR